MSAKQFASTNIFCHIKEKNTLEIIFVNVFAQEFILYENFLQQVISFRFMNLDDR